MIGNLETQCREIIEDKGDDVKSQQDFYQAEDNGAAGRMQEHTRTNRTPMMPTMRLREMSTPMILFMD